MRASEKTELKECGRCSQCVFERCRQLHATDDCGAPKKEEEERTQVRSESHKTNPLLFSYYTPRMPAPSSNPPRLEPAQQRNRQIRSIGTPRNPILRLMALLLFTSLKKILVFYALVEKEERKLNIDRNHDRPQCATLRRRNVICLNCSLRISCSPDPHFDYSHFVVCPTSVLFDLLLPPA